MTGSRTARIPTEHLVAELVAFPLVSEAALSLGLTALDPKPGRASDTLWREAERHILGSTPALSVDELVAMRDIYWFGGDSSRRGATSVVPLHRHLKMIATEILEVRGAAAVPKLPRDRNVIERYGNMRTALARRAWWWLTTALPADLVLAALHGPSRIEVMSPTLQQVLQDKGYAESHLHLGAAFDFPMLWVGTMLSIAGNHVEPRTFESPGASLDEGRHLAAWLIRAAIARYLLASFLASHKSSRDFDEFLCGPVIRELEHSRRGIFGLVSECLLDLQRGRLDTFGAGRPRFVQFQSLYRELTNVGRTGQIRSLSDVQKSDPISHLFPSAEPDERAVEVRFTSAALSYLDRTHRGGKRDHTFSCLFWQVIRTRCLYYRHVVHRPMTPGLQWFVRFYGRLSPTRKLFSTRALVESAARLCGEGRGLRSLEIRVSPGSSRSVLREFVEDVRKTADERCQLEVGIVFHFARDRGGGALKGVPSPHWNTTHANPFHDNEDSSGYPGYRYARFHMQMRRKASALAWVLTNFPERLDVIRGVDVCTDELGVPHWVMAPLIHLVRDAAIHASNVLRVGDDSHLPPIRTTAHAGEDFVHLLTGLRNLDDAIEQFELREGDRVGHALSLGIEPGRWARSVGQLAMAREDRLFDLVWEWSYYGAGAPGHSVPPGRILQLEHEIKKLSYYIFGGSRSGIVTENEFCRITNREIQSMTTAEQRRFRRELARVDLNEEIPTAADLERLRLDLGSARRLAGAGFPEGSARVDWSHIQRDRFLLRYLRDPKVFQRGRGTVWIDAAHECEILVNLQNALRQKLGSRGITVEVNPTSNLLIGDFGDLTNHPLWRLRPPIPDASVPPVSVCVGSDDPLTFASDLRQEYQRLADAMALSGLSDEQSRQWLDRTRAAGLESRFTLPLKT